MTTDQASGVESSDCTAELPDPAGIVLSDGARRYIHDLRQNDLSDVPPMNHGAAAGIRGDDFPIPTQMASSPNDATRTAAPTPNQPAETPLSERPVTRRRAMQSTGAAALMAFGLATSGQSVAAQDIAFDSGLVPNPTAVDTVTIAEHDRSEYDDPLAYTDNAGEEATLADAGGEIAPRPSFDPDQYDPDEDAYNPFAYNPTAIDVGEYYIFPDGETYEDSDGNDQPLSALDPQHWTDSDAEITVADGTGPGEHSLTVTVSGLADAAQAVAEFTDVEFDSGIDQRVLQLVFDVVSIASGAVLNIHVVDSAGNKKTVSIDPSGDIANDNIIATETGDGYVAQVQLGDLATDLDDIQKVQIEGDSGDAEVNIYALSLERASRWVLGEREYYDADDEEVTTETVYENTGGKIEITSLDTMDGVFSSAELDYDVDVWFRAANLPAEQVDSEFVDAEAYPSFESRFKMLVSMELPQAFTLQHTVEALYDIGTLPGDRYLAAEYALNVDPEEGDYLTIADDESEIDFTDKSDSFDTDEVVELTAAISPGELAGIMYDVLVTETEQGSIEDTGSAVAATGREGDSGILDRIMSVPGMFFSALTGLGILAWFRRRGRAEG